MKITISFTGEEKHDIYNMMASTGNTITDNGEHFVGNFGEINYDNSKNEIVYDLKPAFIKASAQLTLSLINISRAFISSCEMFSAFWILDTKDLNKESDETIISE